MKHHDHEVKMAKSQLYRMAHEAVKLHKLLTNISEEEGIEGWVAAKITRASDYISSVYRYLDYEMAQQGIFETPVSESVTLDRSKNPNYPNDPATVKHQKATAKSILSDPASDADSRREAAAILAQLEKQTSLEETLMAIWLEEKNSNKKMSGKDPCWKGYEMIGHKSKNGKKVPNCVPKK